MGIFFITLFIILFIYEINYCQKNNLSYTTNTIVGGIFIVLQIMSILNDITIPYSGNDLSSYSSGLFAFIGFICYYIGFFCLAITGLFISAIPIYKDKRGLKQQGILKHYVEILKERNVTCSRIDYWFLFFVEFLLFFWSLIIYYSLIIYDSSFTAIFIILEIVLIVFNIIFQSKRLEDACINRGVLAIYLLGILGNAFVFIITIVMLVLLCLPTQKIATTDLNKN